MPHGFLSGTVSSDSGNTNSMIHCEPNYGCSQQFVCSEVTGWSLYLSPKEFSSNPGFDTDIYHNRVLPNILLLSSVYLWNVLGGDPTLFWFFFTCTPLTWSSILLPFPFLLSPSWFLYTLSHPRQPSLYCHLYLKNIVFFPETLSEHWRLTLVFYLCSPKARRAQKSHLLPMMKTLSSAVHREYIA